MQALDGWLRGLAPPGIALWGLVVAALVEFVTVFLRFGLGLRAETPTAGGGRLTFGWRIHHGYVGVACLLVGALLGQGAWRSLLLIAGTGLAVSDVVHHFAVLWIVNGDPEFHLRYPGRKG